MIAEEVVEELQGKAVYQAVGLPTDPTSLGFRLLSSLSVGIGMDDGIRDT